MLHHALAYLLWLISIALMVVNIAAIRRCLLRLSIGIAERSGGLHGTGTVNHWTVEAVDQFGLLVLGAIGLVFVIFCEQFYTSGIKGGRLGRRYGIVTGVQVALLALCLI